MKTSTPFAADQINVNSPTKQNYSAHSQSTARSRSRNSAATDRSRTSANSGSNSESSRPRGTAQSEIPGKTAPKEKFVRFNEIHIRNYERVVGDNPSCSSGPPIAIGWTHGNTHIVNVNDYEDARRFRRTEAKLVMNRLKREKMLADWGIPVNEVVDAVRNNIKVKSQRRQTVINLGKAEKIEEAFESATRKLKKAFLLRKRSDDVKVKDLNLGPSVRTDNFEQILRTGKAAQRLRRGNFDSRARAGNGVVGSQKMTEGRVFRECRVREAIMEHEVVTEALKLQPQQSAFWGIAPTNSDGQAPAQIVFENDDTASSLSGFTLGNSTTASALEIENFYRELELEMFGDMELPSMVGQTLEVPDVAIPEEDRIYEEAVISDTDRPFNSSVPETFPEEAAPLHRLPSKPVDYYVSPPGTRKEHQILKEPNPPPLMISHSAEQEFLYSSDSRGINNFSRASQGPQKQHPPQESRYMHHMEGTSRVDGRLRSSMECLALHHTSDRPTMVGNGQVYYPPSQLPPFISGQDANGTSNLRHERRVKESSLQRHITDGPEVRHLPLQSQISTTRFMEGTDAPTHRPSQEAVIISEDTLEGDQFFLFGGGKPYNAPYRGHTYGPQHHPPPPDQHYTRSFYR